MERNISEMIMTPLSAPARRFPAPAPLHHNHCADNYSGCGHKTEWFQGIPEPVKHQQVAEAHGNGRNDHDEE
jgi:hypothetical protein